MKTKSLHFGKAMSAALFILLLSVAGMKNALAQTQVATLQHGDDISVFYGLNALVEANNIAETEDIITLSSGSFVSTTITKSITLRGAGCVADTVNGTNPTIINGNLILTADNDSIPLTIEGISLPSSKLYFGTLVNPRFIRCNFNEVSEYSSNSSSMDGSQFINCIIKTFNFRSSHYTTFINSVVWSPNNIYTNNYFMMYNSILGQGNTLSLTAAYNCIIIKTGASSYAPSSSATFFNCIGIKTGSSNPFGSGYIMGCITYTTYTNVFLTFTGTFSFDESFVLKDEIAMNFLGNDGTQVGLYGGIMPYSNRPSYMVLKRCNVANKSTIDGKLSVEIEVVTEE